MGVTKSPYPVKVSVEEDPKLKISIVQSPFALISKVYSCPGQSNVNPSYGPTVLTSKSLPSV
jgi:hypothetical protein